MAKGKAVEKDIEFFPSKELEAEINQGGSKNVSLGKGEKGSSKSHSLGKNVSGQQRKHR